MKQSFILFLFLVLLSTAKAQLSAPGSVTSLQTNYPSGTTNDPLFVFCASADYNTATLEVRNPFTSAASASWKKLNPSSGTFEYYTSTSAFTQTDRQTGLPSGLYQIEVSDGSSTVTYRAWVINNWIKTEATITDSDCDHFILNGSYTGADLSYIDPISHEKVAISADYNVSWKEGDAVVSHTLKTTIFSPPSENTTYNLTLTDKFGCNAKVSVVYNSLIPSADFTVSPDQGEAPLLVKFTNLSKNADRYTWTLYKDIDVIKTEAEKNSGKVDSVMQQFQTSNIEYKYENSGHYKVKLLAIKTNPDNLTCRDSLYLRSGFIVADTSWVEVPNVFTPNGDNVNDRFTIKTQSLKTFKVSIFNRWGRKLFSYENNNVSSSTETTAHGVWDGKIDGKYASPGVYFYVIEAIGRDNRSRKKTGFVHLFRDK